MVFFDHWLAMPLPGEERHHGKQNLCPTAPEPEAKAHKGKSQTIAGDSLKALLTVSLSPGLRMKIIALNSTSEEKNTERNCPSLIT